eukprot:NODE_18310_length_899_cov_3.588083.p1 GENE.NODE_18310_length_899_cov_3.588083~~NODE_18310_length_899_cov_3.588083.p1  ORF type:complete len:196 (-),score=25.32 NODE_18310_length_899_cov_3.588083:280-867(-)
MPHTQRGTNTIGELIFRRACATKEERVKDISNTSPPGVWPLRNKKLKGSSLDCYYARGFPHEKNNDSDGLFGSVQQAIEVAWPPVNARARVACHGGRSSSSSVPSSARSSLRGSSLVVSSASGAGGPSHPAVNDWHGATRSWHATIGSSGGRSSSQHTGTTAAAHGVSTLKDFRTTHPLTGIRDLYFDPTIPRPP